MYHPVPPRPKSCRPFVLPIYFRQSSPEVLHVVRHKRPLLVKDGITGEKWSVKLASDFDFHVNHGVLLHAANLRHGIEGFTSSLKESRLRIFSPEKSDGCGWDQTRELGYPRPAC
jgi:hypothetical protein